MSQTNAQTTMTNEQMQAMMAQLLAENAMLREKAASRSPKPSLKVSEKGALSVYGMGRFPITLYREQWEKLLAMSSEILAFIKANAKSLATKQ